MFFTSPIWLLGLLPWAAVAAALLVGRRPRRDVPFLPLWQGQAARPAKRRRLARPPVAVLLVLLAALIALLAAAGPAARRPGVRSVMLVVDTGPTMAARFGDRPSTDRRLRRACADVVAALTQGGRAPRDQHPGDAAAPPATAADVTVVVVPGLTRRRVAVGDLLAYVEALPNTAVDTGEPLARAVRRELADPAAGAVVAATDRPLPADDPRVVRFAPPSAGRSLGIRAFALRRTPRPQAMVRLTTETWGADAGGEAGAPRLPAAWPTDVRVRVSAGGAVAERVVAVPPPGQERLLFLDLPPQVPPAGRGADAAAEAPAGFPAATATLVGWDDDLAADDRADLTAEADWPALEPAGPLGDLRRLVDLYRQVRPPGERSVRVRLVTTTAPATAATPDDLGGAPAVAVPAPGSPAVAVRATTVAAHPITAAVPSWAGLDLPAVRGRRPPAGFKPILSAAGGPLVAVRSGGGTMGPEARQVWCGLATDGWANRPEYVAFFSAAFDWAGRADAGPERLSATPLAELTPDWEPAELVPSLGPVTAWPGVWRRRGDGRRRAFGPVGVGTGGGSPVPSPTQATATASDGRGAADRLASVLRAGDRTTAWSPWLLVAAVALAGGAAVAHGRGTKECVRSRGRGRSLSWHGRPAHAPREE